MNCSESVKDVWTVRRILGWTTVYLESKGCETPRLDAEVLLSRCLNMTRVDLYLNFERPLSNSERDSYRGLVSRRAQREPVSLIIGKKEFWSIPFFVAPGVLIPRPDTETLVETVLSELQEFHNPRILELGVGSGAVSIAILKEKPSLGIVGVDINELAIAGLTPEIYRFEPLTALDGGADGLDCIRKIVHEAPDYLTPGGRLILEIGDDQSEAVLSIVEAEGRYVDATLHRDLTGNVRVVKACLR